MRRDPRITLLAAVGCLVGLAATGVVALLLPIGRVADHDALQGFAALDSGGRLTQIADHVSSLGDPRPYGIVGAVLVLIALVRRRLRLAVALPVILVGSAVTTQALKPLLATPREIDFASWSVAPASWPSGHATAAMTIALCTVLVAPPRLRPSAAIAGAVFAVGVGASILVLSWHFPTDVLGGYLVAATWTLAVATVLLALDRRSQARARPMFTRRPKAVLWPAEALIGVLGLVLLAGVASRPSQAAGFVHDHTSTLGMLLLIAALAVALAAGVAQALGEPRRR